MIRVVFGVLVVLHGLVHMLYFGHSRGAFEMQPGMTWPSASWAVARTLGDAAARQLAGVLLVVAAIAFAAGGIGIIAQQTWARYVAAGAAVLSSVIYVAFWDGTAVHLGNQGAIGVLINVAVVAAILLGPRLLVDAR